MVVLCLEIAMKEEVERSVAINNAGRADSPFPVMSRLSPMNLKFFKEPAQPAATPSGDFQIEQWPVGQTRLLVVRTRSVWPTC
jgi:hypothetical protein